MTNISLRDARAAVAVAGLVLATAACATASTPPSTATPVPTTSRPVPRASDAPASSPAASLIALSNATGNDVSVEIVAPGGLVRSAESGTPGDGASVDAYQLLVANDDPATLHLTWTGGPCDVRDTLFIDPVVGQLLLVQPECPGDTVAFDRVLLVHLTSPLDGGTLTAIVQDGTDTGG